MPYEVQHYTLAEGWKNTWSYDEGDGEFHVETFATRDEAEAALDEFFADRAADIAAGLSAPYSRDEFRVAFVSKAAAHSNNQPTGERL